MLQKVNDQLIHDRLDGESDWVTGSMKWFDRQRRFGFIFPDEEIKGHNQVYLHFTQVQDSNIAEHTLKQGTRVRFTWILSPERGPRPVAIRIQLLGRR